MRCKLLCFLTLLTGQIAFGQTAKMELKYGTTDESVYRLMSFQNIYLETVKFKGTAVNEKYYQVFVKEFKESKLIRTDTLFDGTEADIFKIDGDSVSFQLFAQTDNNEVRIQIMAPRFSSKKLKYKTYPKNGDFVLKDFLGIKHDLDVPVGQPFYTFAIITPTKVNEGIKVASYCDVAQSNSNPENFGTKFNIPHYFLIQMVIK